jgi:hypothetical protein
LFHRLSLQYVGLREERIHHRIPLVKHRNLSRLVDEIIQDLWPVEMKIVCKKCNEKKQIGSFYIKANGKPMSYCKTCAKKKAREWEKDNIDKKREGDKKRSQKWRDTNVERSREKMRRWKKNNPEKRRQSENLVRKKRRANDPGYKLARYMSTYIAVSLSGGKCGRHWEAIVGFTLDELRMHLEKKFSDGMSWENYGQWHVDHVIPKSLYRYKSPDDEDFKKCWSLNNLQPLWASDNQSKSNRHIPQNVSPEIVPGHNSRR